MVDFAACWSLGPEMGELEGFEFQVMSDVDYEDLIIEILYQGEVCFLVSQEQGLDRMRLKIYPRSNGEPWEFSVKELEKVLLNAAKRLWARRKIGE